MRTTESLALAYGTAVEDLGGGLTGAVLRPYDDVEVILSVDGSDILINVCPVLVDGEGHDHAAHDWHLRTGAWIGLGWLTELWSEGIRDLRDRGTIQAGS